MTEAQLIAAAKAGDQDAFAELYRTHLSYVKYVGRAILRTDYCEDLCQDVFLCVFQKLATFEGRSSFRTWITRIAMNECLQVLRKAKTAKHGANQVYQLDSGLDALEGLCSEDVALRSVMEQSGVAAILELEKDPLNRRMLEMAYLEDMSMEEIAASTRHSVCSVKARLHYSKERIKKRYRAATSAL